MTCNPIQTFIEALENFEQPKKDIQLHLNKLENWYQQLSNTLNNQRLNSNGLTFQNPIAQEMNALNMQIEHCLGYWEMHLETLKDTQFISDHFENKIILLIFGKFNAGKSSLCNVLAKCFRRRQQSVQYFYIDGDKVIESHEYFKEGATETTTRIQGICLGKNLILLDTPGLHSVTSENAALTQYFLKNADGMLWLSSSTSLDRSQNWRL